MVGVRLDYWPPHIGGGGASRYKVSLMKSSSTDMNPTDMNPTDMNPTVMNPTDMNPTDMDPTDMNPPTFSCCSFCSQGCLPLAGWAGDHPCGE